jgi:hypothetical protein
MGERQAGHLLGSACASARPGASVPGGAHRHRHCVIQGRPDQRVPGRQAASGIGEYARGAGVVNGRHQVRDVTVEHLRQVRHREVHVEQNRRLQNLLRRHGDEVQAVRGGRRQRRRCGAAGQLDGARAGDGQPGAARQRGDQFGDIQRVTRGPAGTVVRLTQALSALGQLLFDTYR